MKKYIYTTICFLFSFGYVPQTQALFCDLTPLNPSPTNYQFDVPGAVASGIELMSSGNAVKVVIDKVKKDLKVDELEHQLSSYVTNLGNTSFNKLMDKIAGKKVTSWSRLIDEKTKVTSDDEDEIQKVFIKRFLQFPSKKDDINNNYRKIGEQFKIDTVLETYIIARGMEMQLEKQLKELDKIEKCLLGGEECDAVDFGKEYNCQESKATEDQMCLWRANLLVARIYDRIMWYNEFLLAIDAQYRAAMMIENGVHIRKYQEDKKQEQSSITKQFLPQQTAQKSYVWQADFASVEWFDGSPAEATVVQDGDFDVIERAGGFAGSLSNQKETFDSMIEIEDANRAIEKALRAHNVKNKLNSYRRVYETYHQAQNYLKKVNEHLAISEECVQNYIGQYYENGIQAWTGHNCSIYDKGRLSCAYGTNSAESIGQFDLPCKNNPSQNCYVIETTDATNRSGLSGLLKERYDEMKTLTAAGEDKTYTMEDSKQENFVSPRNPSSEERQKIRGEGLQSSDNMNKRGESMQADGRSKSPQLEDEMLNDTHIASRLNWLIGSGVTKEMISDINGDQGGFGKVIRRYPLWNDQKEFYDQYIIGKIAAMKEYVSTVPAYKILIKGARVANSLLTYPLAKLRGEEAKAIDALETDISSMVEEDEISTAISQEQSALENIKAQHQYNVAYIKDQIAEESEIIDSLNTEIQAINEEYDALDEQSEYNSSSSVYDEDNIRREQQMYDERAEKGGVSPEDTESPYAYEFQDSVAKKDKEAENAVISMAELKSHAEELETQLDAHQKKIEQLKTNLDSEIRNYIKTYNATMRTYRDKVNNALAQRHANSIQQKIISAADDIMAVSVASSAIQCVRQKIIEKIDDAAQKYQQMQSSDDIYYTENTSQIQGVHIDMIKDIQKIGDEVLTGCGDIEDNVLANVTVKAIVEGIMSMCEKDYCTTPETDNGDEAVYFVSLTGKERDFRAPTGPLKFALPPLREVFYFDEFDYDNVERYFEGDEEPLDNREITITGDSFLNSGAEIPEIWKYILKVRTFEEKEFDLEALFNRGHPIIAVERAGIFPCHYEGKIMDVSYRQDGAKVIFAYNDEGLKNNVIDQTCRLFGHKDGKIVDTESDYAEFIPYIKILPDGTIKRVPPTNVLETSELGQVLAYIPEPGSEILALFGQKEQFKLSYNQAFLSAVNTLNRAEGIDEDNESLEQYKYATRIMFRHNQFGDYLDFVELKEQAEEMLERYKDKMEEVRQKLQEIFNEFGDTISEDFDLANDEDYDMAANSFDGYKAAYIRQATEKLDIIRGLNTVDDIQDKADKLEQKLDILELDEDEVAELLGNEDISEVEYKIKQATANNGIADKYAQKGSEELERQIRQMIKPYCAVYAK